MARTDIQTAPGGAPSTGDVHKWWALGLVCVCIFMLLRA
jgi:hypothetical protein